MSHKCLLIPSPQQSIRLSVTDHARKTTFKMNKMSKYKYFSVVYLYVWVCLCDYGDGGLVAVLGDFNFMLGRGPGVA